MTKRHPIVGGSLRLLALALLVQGCTSATPPGSSDHFDGQRFHNRNSVPEPTFWEEARIAWTLKTKHKNWPDRFETTPVDVPQSPLSRGIRVLWMGHATTLIQTPTLNIITDPILSDGIGPALSRIRTVTNPPITVDRLPHIDLVLISHNHYDHLDLRSIHAIFNRQQRDPPTALVGLGVGVLLRKEGIAPYSELDWNDSVTIKDTRIFYLEAVHTSRRGVWDTNETLWGAFLIDSPEGRIYFAGDSAYGKHFKSVYDRFGPPKVSLLPIGAYEPRWFMYRMHMNPDDAVLAHLDLRSQHSIAIHFGLIDNAAEGYEAPVNALAIARRTHGVGEAAFVAPHLGQLFEYP